jgi:hypothetical protein
MQCDSEATISYPSQIGWPISDSYLDKRVHRQPFLSKKAMLILHPTAELPTNYYFLNITIQNQSWERQGKGGAQAKHKLSGS